MLDFRIITLFPESLRPYLETSMLRKAARHKLIKISLINPRDYTRDKHRKADDRPYGGGPGMVLKAEPMLRTIWKFRNLDISKFKNSKSPNVKMSKFVITSPRGKQFTNAMADHWASRYDEIVIIAGHYEGIDARVKKILKACLPAGRAEEISVGPYTLTGGGLPALVIVDAVTRRLPGVLGKSESLEEMRVASGEVYTRPEVLVWPPISKHPNIKMSKSYRVPKILLSGHHRNIENWRAKAK